MGTPAHIVDGRNESWPPGKLSRVLDGQIDLIHSRFLVGVPFSGEGLRRLSRGGEPEAGLIGAASEDRESRRGATVVHDEGVALAINDFRVAEPAAEGRSFGLRTGRRERWRGYVSRGFTSSHVQRCTCASHFA